MVYEGFCLKQNKTGTPGWLSGWVPAFSSGRDPGIRDRIPHQAPRRDPDVGLDPGF